MAWQMYGSFAKFLRHFPFSARVTYAACCAFVCLFLMRIFLSRLARLSHFCLVRMQIRSRVMHCVTRRSGPADERDFCSDDHFYTSFILLMMRR